MNKQELIELKIKLEKQIKEINIQIQKLDFDEFQAAINYLKVMLERNVPDTRDLEYYFMNSSTKSYERYSFYTI